MILKRISALLALSAMAVAATPSISLALVSTTTLTTSANPSLFGQPLTLTATLSPAAATGKVTFYDGVSVLGVATLSGGQASLATTLLPTGNQSLKAYYAGDGTYSASTSAVVAQKVVSLYQNGFQQQVSHAAQGGPQSIAVGDFNRDGKADVAVANSLSNSVSVLLGHGDGTFQAAVNYGVGSQPTSIAVGDFNGDGRTDLVVANSNSSNVSVLLGNGDGTFQAPVNYSAGTVPNSVAVADFNGDGRADLVIANGGSGNTNSNVSVLLGNGDGTLQAAVNYAVGTSPFSVAAGDFNGDGKADLAVANFGSGNVSILLGNGDGTFRAAVNYNVGGNPSSLAIADFNGDGKADLAVGTGSVIVLLGNGDGTFQAAPPSANAGGAFIAVGDFNGDGTPDIAFTSVTSTSNEPLCPGITTHGSVGMLLGRGDGTFQGGVSYSIGANLGSIVVGDFSGNGLSDLALVNSDNNQGCIGFTPTYAVIILPGDASTSSNLRVSETHAGSFAQGQAGAAYTMTVSNVQAAPTTAAVTVTDTLPAGLMAEAITGPGWSCALATLTCTRADALGAGASYPPITLTVKVASNAPANVTNTATVSGGSPFNTATSTAVDPTIILQSSGVALTQSPNPSMVGQAVTLLATVSAAGATGQVTFYDGQTVLGTSTLSGAKAALVTSLLLTGPHSLRAYYGGSGTYLPSTSATVAQSVVASSETGFRTQVTYSTGTGPSSVVVADFDGNGKADFAVAIQGSNNVVLFLGRGDGTFQSGTTNATGNSPVSLAAGDFNGDGKTDLAVANYGSNNVSILLGNGDGSFQTTVNYNAGSNPFSVAVGDFNGDGKVDLVVANQSGNNLSVLLGNGDGTFQTAVNYGAGTSPRFVAVGDFNGDGKADLAVANYGSNNLSILLGNGDGTFQPAVNYNTGNSPESLAVGDFNGDGKSDIAIGNYGGGVSVLLGNGDGTFRAAANYSAGAFPQSVVVGDVNGDGKADLIVANTGSNTVSVLLGNGDGTFQGAVNYNTGAGPISVALGDFNGDGASDLVVANQNSNSVSILLGAANTPSITNGGVVAAANYLPQMVPGMIASLFGSNLASGITTAGGLPLPAALGGVSVSANGILAPLFYVSPTQINFQLPWELMGQNQASIAVTTNGFATAPQTITLRTASPGVFSTNASGSGQGAIQISNTATFAAPVGSLAQARPVNPGESITIYCSGLGDVLPRPVTGTASPFPPSTTVLTPSVSIGGVPALVTFSGLVPGFVGLYQINATVPLTAPTGAQVTVFVMIGGVTSNMVTIAVQ